MPSSVYVLAQENPSSKSLIGSIASNLRLNSKNSSTVGCRICLSTIMDPASLTCGHKFCEGCLQNYWDAKDRPDYIVCPLCRTNVFNVDFTKEEPTSTNDFRKTFNSLENIPETEEHKTPLPYFKFSFLISGFYFLLRWLGLPILELMSCMYQ